MIAESPRVAQNPQGFAIISSDDGGNSLESMGSASDLKIQYSPISSGQLHLLSVHLFHQMLKISPDPSLLKRGNSSLLYSFSHNLLFFLRSRTSARIGKRKEPPGRAKTATAGMIFAMFLRCILISFFSSFVHFSSVFRVFIRICISPLIESTSIRMASLFITISLLR